MTGYLVELYVSRYAAGELTRAAKRVRESAERLTRTGTAVHFIRTIFVPEDETCFYLPEADSIEAVERAARGAELEYGRIVEAVTEPSDSSAQEESMRERSVGFLAAAARGAQETKEEK